MDPTWQPGDLGYSQFETVRLALEAAVLSPLQRAEALEALWRIYAISEVRGLRALQLNSVVIVDELGEPVTQAAYNELISRVATREIPNDPVFGKRLQMSIQQEKDDETLSLTAARLDAIQATCAPVLGDHAVDEFIEERRQEAAADDRPQI